jgi:hypothetical protein
MLGSELAVCGAAGPPRAHSNAADRIATAGGATKPDDNLMIISSREVGISLASGQGSF